MFIELPVKTLGQRGERNIPVNADAIVRYAENFQGYTIDNEPVFISSDVVLSTGELIQTTLRAKEITDLINARPKPLEQSLETK